MKVYTQIVKGNPLVGCTSGRNKYGCPKESETQDKRRRRRKGAEKNPYDYTYDTGILMTHGVERLLTHF